MEEQFVTSLQIQSEMEGHHSTYYIGARDFKPFYHGDHVRTEPARDTVDCNDSDDIAYSAVEQEVGESLAVLSDDSVDSSPTPMTQSAQSPLSLSSSRRILGQVFSSRYN